MNQAAWPGYVPKLFRWDEDYSYLRDEPGPRAYPLRLKYLPIGESSAYVMLGGEYRLRADDYRQPDFGLRNAPGFTSWQERFLLHGDLHLGATARIFVQLIDALEHGRKPAQRPADATRLDLAQGFVDWSYQSWRLRLGRQEVALGRYIAIRDGTNIRRTFDGLRADGSAAGWNITGLAARATRNRPASFNDDPDPNDRAAALVADHTLAISGLRYGLAFIERENQQARYARGLGAERRKTAGLRIFGARSGWDVDAQASYQFGTFVPAAGQPLEIRAWGAAFEGGRSFAAPWSPRLALRIDTASGDKNAADRQLGTFDLPYPNLSYLTDAAIFAPRNVHDVQPFATVAPSAKLTLTAGAQFLWRNSANDAVFSSSNVPIIGPGGQGMRVATEPYLRLDWRVTPLLEVQSSMVHAIPSAALKSFGATKTLDFFFASVTARF